MSPTLARCLAGVRVLMPAAAIRLSAGRAKLGQEAQALCFPTGAGSIVRGRQRFAPPSLGFNADRAMFDQIRLPRTD